MPSHSMTPPFIVSGMKRNLTSQRSLWLVAMGILLLYSSTAVAQVVPTFPTENILRDVQSMTDRGLAYLLKTQNADGTWINGSDEGAGTTALGLLAFLSSGEDPNFGIYHVGVRNSLRSLIRSQPADTGYLGPSMYHHGFAMLALAEAYGAVDERDLWNGDDGRNARGIGEALELAVRCALTSQKQNPLGAWRYSPTAKDADTSVSGAVMMGLLAARNAGIEVSDEAIERGLDYFISMTSSDGSVGYAGGNNGFSESNARSAIACLVFAIARRQDLPEYQATEKYVRRHLDQSTGWIEYAWYYQSQALFQVDANAWQQWNATLVRKLKSRQTSDGSFAGDLGNANSTSMSILSLALNYRFLPIYER